MDSPKALHRQTPAGKRITPDLDVVIERHPMSHRRTVVRTNQLGLRGPEVPAREVGELRILVLGDSITFGDYVDEDDTYPTALERRLQAAMPARVVRVINGGGPDVGTMDEAALLAELAPELRPDLVLVGFYLNDSVGQAPYPERIRIPAGLGWSRLADRVASAWAREAHAARVRPRYVWVHEFLERGWIGRPGRPTIVSCPWPRVTGVRRWREESWAPVEAALRYMRTLGEQHGFQVAVAAFPVIVQVESRHEDDRPQRRIRALTESLGMPFVDLLPALRASRGQPLFYDHCHLTPAGNAIAAEQIADLLLRRSVSRERAFRMRAEPRLLVSFAEARAAAWPPGTGLSRLRVVTRVERAWVSERGAREGEAQQRGEARRGDGARHGTAVPSASRPTADAVNRASRRSCATPSDRGGETRHVRKRSVPRPPAASGPTRPRPMARETRRGAIGILLAEVGHPGGHVLHQEPQALVIPAGIVRVRRDRQQRAEAAAVLVELVDLLRAFRRVAHDPDVLHQVVHGDRLVGHGWIELGRRHLDRADAIGELVLHVVSPEHGAGALARRRRGRRDEDVARDAPLAPRRPAGRAFAAPSSTRLPVVGADTSGTAASSTSGIQPRSPAIRMESDLGVLAATAMGGCGVLIAASCSTRGPSPGRTPGCRCRRTCRDTRTARPTPRA